MFDISFNEVLPEFVLGSYKRTSSDEDMNGSLLLKGKRKRSDAKNEEAPLEEQIRPDDNHILNDMRENALKRQKLSHELFQSSKLTMRESIIRVLEGKIDPS